MPKKPTPQTVGANTDIAADVASEFRTFLVAVREVAVNRNAEEGVPVLVLALSAIIASGSRLAVSADVLPANRFEPDSGDAPDVEALRDGLREGLRGIDEYVQVLDPMFSPEVVGCVLSDDIAEIASAVAYGLRHYEQEEFSEALWWWQFSYLSAWGDRAIASLRALQSILTHLRLDADADVVAEAEFDALHG